MTDVKAIIDVHNQQQDTIESLRKQLAHSEMAANAEAKYADELRQQLAECQAQVSDLAEMFARCAQKRIEDEAREKRLRDALMMLEPAYAESVPSDSTALDTMLKQAKREALLEAIRVWVLFPETSFESIVRRMAEELK